MVDRYTTHAFIAGELSPEFYNRTDLDQYALGVSLAQNFLVDFRGGMKTAPGTSLFASTETKGRIYAYPVSGGSDIMLFFGHEELIVYDETPATLVTPYDVEDVRDLSFHYKDGKLVVCHIDYSPHELTFDTSWTFVEKENIAALDGPTNITVTATPAGTGTYAEDSSTIYVITAVDAEGNEGRASLPEVFTDLFNFSTEEGSASISWDSVDGAVSYRLYRSFVVKNDDITRAQEVGYIGQTRATSFVDANISPDYTIQPPLFFNPFATGSVLSIEITAGGSGYSDASTLTIGGGTGFSGYPLIVDGAVVGIVIQNGGTGYTTASSVSVSGGTGATLAITEVSPADGLYPSCSTVFQARRVYAGQMAAPLVLYGSKREQENNFDYSSVPNAADAYVLPLDVDSAFPITHLEKMQNTLLCFHKGGIEALRGKDGEAITAISYNSRNQTNLGAAAMAPQRVGNDIVYASALGTQIISLNYTYYTESFQEQDVSVRAPHLFGKHLAPKRLVWQREPDKLLWVLRENGSLAVLTYMKEQETYAWAQRSTDGVIIDVCIRRTPSYDYLYWLVERNGEYFIEEMQERIASPAEEYWGVDCGLRYEGARETTKLVISVEDGQKLLTRGAGSWASYVGYYVRAGGGLFLVTADNGSGVAEVTEIRAAFRLMADNKTIADSSWTLAEAVDTVIGLDHLEGREVAVVGDGDYLGLFTVEDGEITFPRAYSLITVGLPYECELHSLPLSNLQLQSDGRKKRVIGAAVRLLESQGLEIGVDKYYEVKPAVPTYWGQQPALMSEITKITVESKFERDQVLKFKQRYPVPAAILGFVVETEMED